MLQKKNPKKADVSEADISGKTDSLTMRILGNSHHHFLNMLPSRTGLVPWILERLFGGITFSDEQLALIRTLPKDAVIVYTIKYKSYFEFYFYHTRMRQKHLPVPELGFNYRFIAFQPVSRILRSMLASAHFLARNRRRRDPFRDGYWEKALLEQQRTALLPLVEKGEFYRRFIKAKTDPARFLIELQAKTKRPVFLVPLLMFFSKQPSSSVPRLRDIILGTEQRPGIVRRLLTLIRHPGKVFVEVSPPVNLSHFLQQPECSGRSTEYQALVLRHKLLKQHNRHRQSITGPVVKSREEIKENILASERMRRIMTNYAKTRKMTLHAVRKKADEYLDEIAAKYNFFFIRMMSGLVGWLLNTMFDGTVINKEGLQQVKSMSQKGPLILVPCHKSHIDYLILSYVLYHNNMPCPHIAAGKNLSFWPLGPIFRAGGAFFLRRTFRGAILYSKVFSEYIHKLLEEGFNIEMFIEGGRSRTGKLLMPKLGLLSILLNAFRQGACEDLIFVPVFIGYDQVLEEDAYLHEIEGGKKEPENLSQVLRARKFLKKRYGKIYINFHQPLSLRQILENFDKPLDQMPQKEINALCRNLGWRIINAIDRVTVVTPYSLAAAAILNCPQRHFTYDDLFNITDTYLHFLLSQKAQLTDTLTIDPQRSLEQAVEAYLQRKLIEPISADKKTDLRQALLTARSAGRPLLEYYKNNCIAYFVPAALTAQVVLAQNAFQFASADLMEEFAFLQEFFKYEFAFDVNQPSENQLRKAVKSFIDDAILIPHKTLPDTYNITADGLRKLKLYARFLKTYFESYSIALQYYKQTPRKKIGSGKERLKKIRAIGKSLLKSQQIELPESLSEINFGNAISFFTTHGIKGSENGEQIKYYEQQIQRFLQAIDK